MQLAGAEKVTAASERTRKPAAPSGDQRDPTNAGGRDSPAQSARPAGPGGQRHHSTQAWRHSDGERVGGSAEPALPSESRSTGSLGRRLRRPELPGTRPACAPLRPPSATAAPGGREAPGVAPLHRTDRRRRCSATAAAAPAGCPAAEGPRPEDPEPQRPGRLRVGGTGPAPASALPDRRPAGKGRERREGAVPRPEETHPERPGPGLTRFKQRGHRRPAPPRPARPTAHAQPRPARTVRSRRDRAGEAEAPLERRQTHPRLPAAVHCGRRGAALSGLRLGSGAGGGAGRGGQGPPFARSAAVGGRAGARRRDGPVAVAVAAAAAAAWVPRAAPAAPRRGVQPLPGQRLHLHAARRPQGVLLPAHAQGGLAGAGVPGGAGPAGVSLGRRGPSRRSGLGGRRAVPHPVTVASLPFPGRGRCWAVRLPVPFT